MRLIRKHNYIFNKKIIGAYSSEWILGTDQTWSISDSALTSSETFRRRAKYSSILDSVPIPSLQFRYDTGIIVNKRQPERGRVVQKLRSPHIVGRTASAG